MNARMDAATALKVSLALTDADRLPPRQYAFESPVAYRARCIRTARSNNLTAELRKAFDKVESAFRTYTNAIEARDEACRMCRGESGPDDDAGKAIEWAEIARSELKEAFKAKWALQAKQRNMIYGTER